MFVSNLMFSETSLKILEINGFLSCNSQIILLLWIFLLVSEHSNSISNLLVTPDNSFLMWKK